MNEFVNICILFHRSRSCSLNHTHIHYLKWETAFVVFYSQTKGFHLYFCSSFLCVCAFFNTLSFMHLTQWKSLKKVWKLNPYSRDILCSTLSPHRSYILLRLFMRWKKSKKYVFYQGNEFFLSNLLLFWNCMNMIFKLLGINELT